MTPLFTPNFRAGLRVLKPKSRDLLPQNMVQTNNLLISSCSQNFMQLDLTVLELLAGIRKKLLGKNYVIKWWKRK